MPCRAVEGQHKRRARLGAGGGVVNVGVGRVLKLKQRAGGGGSVISARVGGSSSGWQWIRPSRRTWFSMCVSGSRSSTSRAFSNAPMQPVGGEARAEVGKGRGPWAAARRCRHAGLPAACAGQCLPPAAPPTLGGVSEDQLRPKRLLQHAALQRAERGHAAGGQRWAGRVGEGRGCARKSMPGQPGWASKGQLWSQQLT